MCLCVGLFMFVLLDVLRACFVYRFLGFMKPREIFCHFFKTIFLFFWDSYCIRVGRLDIYIKDSVVFS